MGKVKGYFTELQSLGIIPTPEPTEEEMNQVIEEPTDAELAEIENLIDNEFYLD
tara:strand:+ start:285 stop:446 length:162 start_codon:yes stop_codon:yes gene_type:complete